MIYDLQKEKMFLCFTDSTVDGMENDESCHHVFLNKLTEMNC